MEALPAGFQLEQPTEQPLPTAPESGLPEGFQLEEEKYGTTGQQAIAALEGLAKGVAGPLAPLVETKVLGVKPEAITAREELHPWTHGLAQTAGLVGSMLTGVGEAGLILKGAEAAVGATKLGKAALAVSELGPQVPSAAAKVGAAALKGAIEMGMFQGSDEISKAILGHADPETPVASAIAHMGAAGVLGGAFGGVFGAAGIGFARLAETKMAVEAKKALEELGARTAVPAAEEMTMENAIARTVPTLDKEAAKTMEVYDRLGIPVLKGNVAGDRLTQMAEDTLLKAPYTVEGGKRNALYQANWNTVTGKVENLFPAGRVELEDAGNALTEGLTKEIANEAALHNERYALIKELTPEINVVSKDLNKIAKGITEIEGVKSDFTSPAARLARNIAKELEAGNIQTVDQLEAYRSRLGKRFSFATLAPEDKRIISITQQRLNDLTENTIERHADKFVSDILARKDLTPDQMRSIWGDKIDRLMNLNAQVKEAKTKYAPFRKKFSELTEWLGKGSVGGPKDAIDFIQNRLEPEDVIKRLTSHKYAGLPKFLRENFPEQYDIIRNFEKAKLYQDANKGKTFNYNKLLKDFNALPRAFREAIFTPEEIQLLQDADHFFKKVPPSFNPSGTSHVNALREWATNPAKMASAEARDVFLKHVIVGKDVSPQLQKIIGGNATDAEAAAALKVLSQGETQGLYQVLQYVKQAERGAKQMGHATESLFKAGGQQAIEAEVTERQREQLKKYIEEDKFTEELNKQLQKPSGQGEPQNFAEGGEVKEKPSNQNHLSTYLPEQAMLMQAAKARIVNVLSQAKPQKPAQMPFDMPTKNKAAERNYNKLLDLAIKPLGIMNDVKRGSLTTEKLGSFVKMYPELYNQLSQQITHKVTEAQLKGVKPDYKTRQAMSLFLGAPLESNMTPQAIALNQSIFAQAKGQAQQAAAPMKPKKSTAPLSKTANAYETPDQSRAQRYQRNK